MGSRLEYLGMAGATGLTTLFLWAGTASGAERHHVTANDVADLISTATTDQAAIASDGANAGRSIERTMMRQNFSRSHDPVTTFSVGALGAATALAGAGTVVFLGIASLSDRKRRSLNL